MLSVIHCRVNALSRHTFQPPDPINVEHHRLAAPEKPFLRIKRFQKRERMRRPVNFLFRIKIRDAVHALQIENVLYIYEELLAVFCPGELFILPFQIFDDALKPLRHPAVTDDNFLISLFDLLQYDFQNIPPS